MKKIIIAGLVLMSVFSSKDGNAKPPVPPVEVVLSVDHEDKDLVATLTFTNNSDVVLYVDKYDIYTGVAVVDDSGKVINGVEYRFKRKGRPEDYKTLKPGEKELFQQKLETSNQLDKPGKFSLYYEGHVYKKDSLNADSVSVRSNTVEFSGKFSSYVSKGFAW